jgi:hypothetical protein
MRFYVYIGTHLTTKQFYIGSRTSKRIKTSPENDLGINYFTSSKIVKQLGFENFKWEIVLKSSDALEIYNAEQLLIEEHISNTLNINLFYRKKFSTTGKVWTEQERINHSKVQKGRTISENQKAKIVIQVSGMGNPNCSGISNEEFKSRYLILCDRINGIPSFKFFKRWHLLKFESEFPVSMSKFRFNFGKDLWPILESETGHKYYSHQKWDTKLNPADFI